MIRACCTYRKPWLSLVAGEASDELNAKLDGIQKALEDFYNTEHGLRELARPKEPPKPQEEWELDDG